MRAVESASRGLNRATGISDVASDVADVGASLEDVGGRSERANLDVVKGICASVDRLRPGLPHAPCETLI